MWLYILIAVVVIILIFFFITYNSFVKENNKVNEAFATMDVYLKKRWDLIPNIIETVKGYAKHEKDTLKEIVELRNNVDSYDKLSADEKIKTNEKMSSSITKIMALAESYPDLKANENFLSLQTDLSSIEDEIAQARKYYNAVVRDYNNKVQMIPTNIVAMILGYKTKAMFETAEAERENVKVSF